MTGSPSLPSPDTTIKLQNISAAQGGACTVSEWRVNAYKTIDDWAGSSSWQEGGVLAGQTGVLDLTQLGWDGQYTYLEIQADIAGGSQSIRSGKFQYIAGESYNLEVVGPSCGASINGPN